MNTIKMYYQIMRPIIELAEFLMINFLIHQWLLACILHYSAWSPGQYSFFLMCCIWAHTSYTYKQIYFPFISKYLLLNLDWMPRTPSVFLFGINERFSLQDISCREPDNPELFSGCGVLSFEAPLLRPIHLRTYLYCGD